MSRHVALTALLLTVAAASLAQESSDPDLQLLRTAAVGTDTAALLRLLDQRTLRDEDRPAIERLIRQLDADGYDQRQSAARELGRRGALAVPFLQAALKGEPSLETRRRAEELIRTIESSAGRDTTVAAVRVLAARKAPGGIETILRYLPNADDDWMQEEVLTSLGRLAVVQGVPDARLLAALHDPVPLRRAGVAYLIGRRGNAEQRGLVRAFLADPDPLVRERAVQGLLGKRVLQAQQDGGPADLAILKSHNIPATAAALIAFLRQRTPDATEQARLARLVTQLGSVEYDDRFLAAAALVKAGTRSLAFLRPALGDRDAEVARRARMCISDIQRGSSASLAAAVVRRLAWPGLVQDAPAAIHALLDFVPFAEDESVEEEVLTALTLLCVRRPTIEPALSRALTDSLPARRAAAAYTLGYVGTAEHMAPVRGRLDDASAAVRWRGAQGLLAARDKAAVPVLIALLGELPPATRWRVEETLHRLAGDAAPVQSAGATAASRQQAVFAWQKWWSARQGTIDLAQLNEGALFLGMVTVCEYDSVVAGRFAGQVWEGPRNGSPRFKVGNLVGPMDAQVLSNGHVLVAENGANRVTERDRDGNVKWEYVVQGSNPICCQRLPNGNTFIAMYNQLLEVRPDRTEVYRYIPGPQFYVFCARKTRNGTVACITAQGAIIEVDPLHNKTVRTVSVGQPVGGWAGIEPLANGNYLVATMNNNTIREVDVKGTTVWSINSPIPGVFRATRLPNGNHLIVSMTTREVAELDRSGAIRWRHACQGRPWNVHYR
jgi:HEAT repeat protein